MSKKIIHVSKEDFEASEKELEEMMSKDPEGKKEVERLAKWEKEIKEEALEERKLRERKLRERELKEKYRGGRENVR